MKNSKLMTAIMYIVLISVFLATIFPIIYTITASFKSNIEILTEPGTMFPKKPTFSNYIEAWNSKDFNVGRMLVNSIMYTLVNVATTIIISSSAGYVFARGEFPGKKVIFVCLSLMLFVKTGGLEIYPKFTILNALHINSGLYALMFLHLFGIPIVNIYLVRGFVYSIPRELDEAAQIDGLSFIGTFFKIIMPLLMPILATIGIMAFQGSWNEYIMPTIFTATKPEQQTLIVGLMALKSSSGAATNWGLMLAGAVIALAPVLVAYGIGNRYFLSGLASGAVKG